MFCFDFLLYYGKLCLEYFGKLGSTWRFWPLRPSHVSPLGRSGPLARIRSGDSKTGFAGLTGRTVNPKRPFRCLDFLKLQPNLECSLSVLQLFAWVNATK